MLVVRDLIYNEKSISKTEFLEKLRSNDEEFLKLLRNHSVSFGNDNDDANAMTSRISTDVYSMLDDKKPFMGEGFVPASIQFMSQVDAGRYIGATPDGRSCGAPLCDSLAAIFGKDTKGPTALLKSVTHIDLKRALGVPVLNFNINPDFNNGILKALVLSYMKIGGIQMQISCTSAKMLEEAYENPEMHKNLVVRVGGYSEYFCNLTDELKRMVIARTIQKI
jgi:formate C-acetyltransferase